MFKYICKRLGLALIILLGVSLVIYTLVRSMPTDFVDNQFMAQITTGVVTEEQVQMMKALYGLDDNSAWGIISGYFEWLWNLMQGKMGRSFVYKEEVTTVIRDHMWISFAIAFISMVLQFLVAIPLGVSAATHQYSVRDYVVTVLVMIGISLPSFFFAYLLIKVFAVDLGWFPIGGELDPTVTGSFSIFMNKIWHWVLPVVTLTVINIGGLTRYTRTNTLEVLNADYIRTARAKGLGEGKVIYKHAFRNTMVPIVTLLAGILPSLFSGSMITEQVFSISGIGGLSYKAMINSDIPFIMGYNMFLAVLAVLGTLLSDLMYAVVDPRVKLS